MSDFGGRLRTAREHRGISLRAIADATKISVAALEALERNDPSRLPGGIFSRAIVRAYASEAGLDPDSTVREFLQRFGLDPGPATLEAQQAADRQVAEEHRQRAGAMFVKIVLATLVVALILYLAFSKRPDHQSSEPIPPDHASTRTPSPS